MMEAAMKREGLSLMHVIGGKAGGPKVGHGYEKNAKKELSAPLVDLAIAAGQRADSRPVHDLHAAL